MDICRSVALQIRIAPGNRESQPSIKISFRARVPVLPVTVGVEPVSCLPLNSWSYLCFLSRPSPTSAFWLPCFSSSMPSSGCRWAGILGPGWGQWQIVTGSPALASKVDEPLGFIKKGWTPFCLWACSQDLIAISPWEFYVCTVPHSGYQGICSTNLVQGFHLRLSDHGADLQVVGLLWTQ